MTEPHPLLRAKLPYTAPTNSSLPPGNFFMTQIKRLLVPFLAVTLISPLLNVSLALAAVAANYTNTGAPTVLVGANAANVLVMDVTAPDAWNGASFTADIVQKAGSTAIWQGDTLNSITALGSTTGVGFKDDVTAGFQGTEAVVRDLDADSAFTSTADAVVDCDGSTTNTAGGTGPGNGACGALSGGGALISLGSNLDFDNNGAADTRALCTDSLTAPTQAVQDNNGNCGNGATGTAILGTSGSGLINTLVTNKWAFKDLDADNLLDLGEDVYIQEVAGKTTYSASADTNVYSTAGLVAADALIDFPADCDGAGTGTQACKFSGASPINTTDSIVVDEGTAAGAAPNSIVDKQADQLIGLGAQNTGTAVNTTDLTNVKLWAESGATAGYQSAQDTLLGAMTVNSGNNLEWRIGSLTTAIAAGGLRLYVTADVSATPTAGNTMIFQIPLLNDAGADGVVTADNDRGVFVSSNNDGPTDGAILNANTQTISLGDITGPVISEVTPVPTPGNNRTPSYTFTTNEAGTISYPGTCTSGTTSAVVGSNTIAFDSLSDGIYTLCKIVVTDGSTNSSNVLTATSFTIDGSAPNLSEVTPVTTPTTDNTPSYTFNTDEAGTIAFGGGCTSAATTNAPIGNTTFDFDTLTDGTYAACTISVIDALGNTSTPLAISSFTIDTTAPTIGEMGAITSPTSDNTPGYSFITTEDGTITYGGSCASGSTAAVAPNVGIVFNALLDGTYSDCTITVTDALGQVSNLLAVTTFTVDTSGVTLTETTPIAALTNDNTPSYSFDSDTVGDISYGGDCTSATLTATIGTNTITFNLLSDGLHNNCTIIVTDATFTPSNTLNVSAFTVDTAAPSLAEVTPVATPDNDATPAYTFSSNEAGAITYGGSCSSATGAATAANNAIDFSTLTDGTYSDCTVQVTDAAGNASSVLPVTAFTIDTVAPTLAEVTPVPTPANDTTPDYTFSSDEAGTISYSGDCSSATTAATATNNTVTFNALSVAIHNNCGISVTDAAGNQSFELAVTSFEVTTPPVPPTSGTRSIFTHPAIELTVSSVGGVLVNGQAPVTFTYSAFNRGDVELNTVSITSDLCSTPTFTGGDVDSDGLLDLTEVWTFTCDASVTATVTNNASVNGQFNGATVSDPASTVVVVTDGQALCTDVAAATESCVDTTQQPSNGGGNGGNGGEIGVDIVTPNSPAAPNSVMAHALIKVAGKPAVFYISPDNKKHLFINEKVYKTWYCSFGNVQIVSNATLATFADGSAVTYRPGVRMVKVPGSAKVYAVESKNTLRWITTPELAEALYGPSWNGKISDIASTSGYVMGADITDASQYNPLTQEQSVTVPADVMNIAGYIPSPVGEGLVCGQS